jgi:hypothetical protein
MANLQEQNLASLIISIIILIIVIILIIIVCCGYYNNNYGNYNNPRIQNPGLAAAAYQYKMGGGNKNNFNTNGLGGCSATCCTKAEGQACKTEGWAHLDGVCELGACI